MMRRFVARSFVALAVAIPAFSGAGEQPERLLTALSGPAISGFVSTRAHGNAARIEYPPQIVTGTWSTMQCRRGTETPGGTFTLAVSERRRLDGFFVDAETGATAKFTGRITPRGIVRGRVKQGRVVRGVATGTTNVEIYGVFFGRCVGTFDTAPAPAEAASN